MLIFEAESYISDKGSGLAESIPEFHPGVKWRCFTVHFYRNVFVPDGKVKEIAGPLMLRRINRKR